MPPLMTVGAPDCCCSAPPPTCRVTIGLQAPTSCYPPVPEYSSLALTGVVTDSTGHVVTDFGHMSSGIYHIDVTVADPLCTTSFPPGTPGTGCGGFSTCLTFDPDTVGYDFTVACPGTNNFTFTGPPIDAWSACVTFILGGGISFNIPNPGGDCACNSPDRPCCQVRLDYDATVTTASGDTFSWSYVGGSYTTAAIPGSFCYTDDSLTFYPYMLLHSDGFGATTITGNVTYVSRAKAANPLTGACAIPSQTIDQDFTLNLCDGLSQTVVSSGPCIG